MHGIGWVVSVEDEGVFRDEGLCSSEPRSEEEQGGEEGDEEEGPCYGGMSP